MTAEPMLRPALAGEYPVLARLWHDAWHEAHAAHVPPALTAQRTEASFLPRLEAAGDTLRVAGPPDAPLGFCAIKGDEIYQLFTTPAARGAGVAQTLLADGEARLRAGGTRRAWLDCIMENGRARMFYTRMGWTFTGPRDIDLYTSSGPFSLRVAIFEKDLH